MVVAPGCVLRTHCQTYSILPIFSVPNTSDVQCKTSAAIEANEIEHLHLRSSVSHSSNRRARCCGILAGEGLPTSSNVRGATQTTLANETYGAMRGRLFRVFPHIGAWRCLDGAIGASANVGEGGSDMLILILLLMILLLAAAPAWPYSRGWGYYPTGTLGTILLILILLLLLGYVHI